MSNVPITPLDLYIVTYNCGRAHIDIDSFASQLFNGLSEPKLPDVLVLALQEIAPLGPSLIGGSLLKSYYNRIDKAVQKAGGKINGSSASADQDGPSYKTVTAWNVGMIAIMVYTLDGEAIQDLETAGVGFGVREMGNKAAAGTRFTYRRGALSTELTFVSAHLEAMEDEVQTRNDNWKSIVRGLVFSSTVGSHAPSSEERPLLSISSHDASIYKSTSHLFVAGDLNYRTSTIAPSPTDHAESFPQPHHDESSPQHMSALFENDQLNQERLAGRTCHGLVEAPVKFPPTYKYDPKEPFNTPDEDLTKWHWATHRWPSWCDRILYLDVPSWLKAQNPDAKITTHKYTALPLFPTSDHRAVVLHISVPLLPIPKPDEEEERDNPDPRIHPPYDIDIDWRSKREKARRLELMTGLSVYCTTTVEGIGGMTATLAVFVGAVYYMIQHGWLW